MSQPAMPERMRLARRVAVLACVAAGLVVAAPGGAHANPIHLGAAHHHRGYGHAGHRHRKTHRAHRRVHNIRLNQVNLFSDIPGVAAKTDGDLINPWGLASTPAEGVWVAEQGGASASAYTLARGADTGTDVSGIDVKFPDSALPLGGPTGQVANHSSRFVLKDGNPATFIYDTLDGRIEAWNPADGNAGNAESETSVPGAGYTGLAIARTRHGAELFAANFATGGIDVFDSNFHQVKLKPWQFHDRNLPSGYLAFNAQTLDGHVFVTYDTINPDPAPGAGPEGIGRGIGVVDEFSTAGRLIARIATGGPLNAPWGLAIAPRSWGAAAGSLLVGNFGDGHITSYAKHGFGFARHATGQVLNSATGKPFAEPGLWALHPGTTANTGGRGALWFSAGISDQQGGPLEHHGLLGVLRR